MTYTLKLNRIEPVTHDTYHLSFEKPEGFHYTPGQATELAIDKDGLRDEGRPFTFTSLPGEDTLDFVIKSYPDHDGVTREIPKLQPGDTVQIGDAWGAIEDKGPGVFVAGGAGVTPFIPILRKRLADQGTLEGTTLVFSNQREQDIILRETFEEMPGLTCKWIVTDEPDSAFHNRMVDAEMLRDIVKPDSDTCYVCGPDPMVEAIAKAFAEIGVPDERVVTEDFD